MGSRSPLKEKGFNRYGQNFIKIPGLIRFARNDGAYIVFNDIPSVIASEAKQSSS
ncbi:MAG: hypothetical protein WCG04_01285 [Alphaproteobacteria bacterium]